MSPDEEIFLVDRDAYVVDPGTLHWAASGRKWPRTASAPGAVAPIGLRVGPREALLRVRPCHVFSTYGGS